MKKYEKENWGKMRYFVPLPTYFNYCVTGNLLVSTGDCAGHYPFNFDCNSMALDNSLNLGTVKV